MKRRGQPEGSEMSNRLYRADSVQRRHRNQDDPRMARSVAKRLASTTAIVGARRAIAERLALVTRTIETRLVAVGCASGAAAAIVEPRFIAIRLARATTIVGARRAIAERLALVTRTI